MADISGAVAIVMSRVDAQIIPRCARASNELHTQAVSNVLNNRSPSPPGSPPGVRTGNLRRNWSMLWGQRVIGITSVMEYSGYLEHGTSKMAARPFKQRIIDASMPKINAIFNEPYT